MKWLSLYPGSHLNIYLLLNFKDLKLRSAQVIS